MSQTQVNIADLDLSSLQQVKVQLEEELSHLTQSYGKLKKAESRFKDCSESVKELKDEKELDKTILVPLTSSLYVPGKISNVQKVIVDVGTGYYVEKPVGSAAAFYDEKIKYVKENLEKLEQSVTSKQSSLRAIVSVMQEKMQEQGKSGK